MIVEKL